jgi:transketolase
VVRPADGPETAAAWTLALERRGGPTAILLSRQDLPPLPRAAGFDTRLLRRGGYVVRETGLGAADARGGQRSGAPLVLIATGSEVSSILEAQTILETKGIGSRVVSMPCPQIYLEQDEEYRRSVVPPGSRTVVVEAAVPQGWERIAGIDALLVGVTRFGASAPWKILQDKYGLSGARVAETILRHPA